MIAMAYWLDLFTGTTWRQFREAGAVTTGFRHSQRSALKRVRPGDVFVCYLTGVMRFVGALGIVGPGDYRRPLWGGVAFPVRFEVKPIVLLDPEHGIPMESLLARTSHRVEGFGTFLALGVSWAEVGELREAFGGDKDGGSRFFGRWACSARSSDRGSVDSG